MKRYWILALPRLALLGLRLAFRERLTTPVFYKVTNALKHLDSACLEFDKGSAGVAVYRNNDIVAVGKPEGKCEKGGMRFRFDPPVTIGDGATYHIGPAALP